MSKPRRGPVAVLPPPDLTREEFADLISGSAGHTEQQWAESGWDVFVDVFADIATMAEHAGRPLQDVACCYTGDARNLTARTLLVAAALLGMDIRVAAPRALWPPDKVLTLAEDLAAETDAAVLVTSDVGHAVLGADFIYTGPWEPAGEAGPGPFRVTADLVASTGRPTMVLHGAVRAWREGRGSPPRPLDLLPARHVEVADDVLGGKCSLLREQAVNRARATATFTRRHDEPKCKGTGQRGPSALRRGDAELRSSCP